MDDLKEIEKFIDDWQGSSPEAKKVFIHFKEYLQKKEGVNLFFNARPKISYSLRAKHINQKDRDLFVMVDVIDDDPENRWFSICFYEDMITDSEEKGDIIPEGLLGQDGYCFDLEDYDESSLSYIEKRLDEAWESAKK